ncbi:MAG: hypothetical protein RLZZ63_650 [Gemmatimonadota bacterium]|jgi:hypothetical protein
MAKTPQNYSNHAMMQPLWHYVAFPAATVFLAYAISMAARSGSIVRGAMLVLFGAGAVATVWASRTMALTLQNRIIRLEMQLRLKEVLTAPLAERAKALTLGQMIALRFASDAELPGLVERVLKGELTSKKEIKQAVKEWQADHLRA